MEGAQVHQFAGPNEVLRDIVRPNPAPPRPVPPPGGPRRDAHEASHTHRGRAARTPRAPAPKDGANHRPPSAAPRGDSTRRRPAKPGEERFEKARKNGTLSPISVTIISVYCANTLEHIPDTHTFLTAVSGASQVGTKSKR